MEKFRVDISNLHKMVKALDHNHFSNKTFSYVIGGTHTINLLYFIQFLDPFTIKNTKLELGKLHSTNLEYLQQFGK